MNFENMLNERSQSHKAIYYMTPFIWNVQNRQIHRARKWVIGCVQLRGGGNWAVTANRCGVSFGVINCSGIRQQQWLHNIMNILKTTD